jgi:hypothetical protein
VKILDPAETLGGTGVTVEVLPLAKRRAPFRLPFLWRLRSRRWWATTMENFDANYPRFRLRVLDESGHEVLSADDYQLYLTLLYSGER